MEHTDLLEIVIDNKFSEMEIAIHPNDGEDLNLYTTEHTLMIYAGQSIDNFKKGEGQLGEGELHLKNDCQLGTIILSDKLLEKLNFCEKAIIVREKENIFLAYR